MPGIELPLGRIVHVKILYKKNKERGEAFPKPPLINEGPKRQWHLYQYYRMEEGKNRPTAYL